MFYVDIESAGRKGHVSAISDSIWRVSFAEPHVPSFAVAAGLPEDDEVATGRIRTREELTKSLPRVAIKLTGPESGSEMSVETRTTRLVVAKQGAKCRWYFRRKDEWISVAEDRGALNLVWSADGRRVSHYQRLVESDQYFGLGECSGGLDRMGRRIRLANTDAMGYDAEFSQPLYKNIPFFLKKCALTGAVVGIFYDALSDCTFDFGCERSNYFGRYRYVEMLASQFDYYVITGSSCQEIVRQFTELTGRPLLSPKWAFGYSGSTMTYTDAPNARERMSEFVSKLEQHGMVATSFHLSSGYTSIGGKRYVFNWNRQKFPDPAEFFAYYRQAGMEVLPNIKPCLLEDHPFFQECQDQGLFIEEMVQFWDAQGKFLDFTNPATQQWWKKKLTETLLQYGVRFTWNDNNEYETILSDVRCHNGLRAVDQKSLLTFLMVRSSREAQIEHSGGHDKFLVTRCGFAGMQRFAQTWSGDNFSAWKTLRFNLRMGLGLALSGVSNFGHDVGGFTGERPEEELFVRWNEALMLHPRFSIHSWHTNSVNEPWMYPASTHLIRSVLNLRTRFIPTLFHLFHVYHLSYQAVVVPVFYHYEGDARTLPGGSSDDDYLLGEDILVAPVLDKGCQTRTVYFPDDFCCYYSAKLWSGGEMGTVPAPLGRPPFFLRRGSLILTTEGIFFVPPPSDQQVHVISKDFWIEERVSTSVHVECTGDQIVVTGAASLILPRWETRPVIGQVSARALDSEEGSWKIVYFV